MDVLIDGLRGEIRREEWYKANASVYVDRGNRVGWGIGGR